LVDEVKTVNRLWQKHFEAEIVRDSGRNLAVGGEPVFPFIPADILVGQFRGKWENTPEALNGVKHEGER